MFAVGHFALGYLTGKGSSKLLKTKLNLPLLLFASIVPDVDLVLERFNQSLFMHRGPAHSIVTFTVLMIPFFVAYRKQAIPYYGALLSHSLLGDLFTGGIEMLWPVSTEWFGDGVSVYSIVSIVAEIVLFIAALSIMVRERDLHLLWKPRLSNLFLIVPFGAVVGPLLQLSIRPEGSTPLLLFLPSLFWAVIFAYSMIVSLVAKLEEHLSRNPKTK